MKFENVAEEWFSLNMYGLSVKYIKSVKCSVQHLCRSFGGHDIAEIKPKDLDYIISSLSRLNPNTGKPAAKKTVQQMIRIANNIFDYAIENDLITKSPATNKKPPKHCTNKVIRSLTNTEKALVLTTPHRAKLPAMVMMFAGLRRGEIIALKWSDIDLGNQKIFVGKAAAAISGNKFTINPHTKNGNRRWVHIPDLLVHYLITEQKNARYSYVTSQIDGALHTPSSWNQMWRSYNKSLNIANNNQIGRSICDPKGIPRSLENIGAHMLRHTYATMLWTAGVDVKSAAKMLGHADVATTLKIYTHLEMEKEEVSISIFDDYITERSKCWQQELGRLIIF